MYKDTLKDSGAGDKSVEELQEDGDDEDAGDQETDQPPDLIDYQLVRDREPRTRTKPLRFQNESNMAAYAFAIAEEEDNHEPLTYQEAVACEDSSKWKAAMGRGGHVAIEKKTPMEMWLGHPSDYGVEDFGCVAYPRDKQHCQLTRDREPRTRTKPLRFQDESNMAAYVFAAAEEEDTHEPLTYQEAVACEDSSKYKVRLVARGFTQRAGMDYNEVFSLVVRHTSIRVILALTACKDYDLEELDVKMAFLHGNLEEQSPRQWYKRFDEYMLSVAITTAAYITGVMHQAKIGSTKSLLKKKFDMKVLGEAKKILGMEIVRDRSRKILRVSQSGFGKNVPWELYETEILRRFGDVYDDLLVELKILKQSGDVQSYQDKFEMLLNKVDLTEPHVVSIFMTGLKSEIGAGVIKIVGFNLEGVAVEWFQWMSQNGLITTWDRFMESVKSHFGSSKYKDPKGALSKLLQLGTLEDYQQEFEKLMNRVTDIPDSLLISFNISGLKLNLQHELLLSRPTTLGDAFSLARITEARLEVIAKKEHNIIEKADTTLSLPIEKVSPMVKGPLDARHVDEVRDKFAEFFKDKGSVEKVLSATKLPKGGNSHSAYSLYHLQDKVNFEGMGNVTPWAAEVRRRTRVKCYVQGSGRWKRKKVIGGGSERWKVNQECFSRRHLKGNVVLKE
ncbi:retrotransposon protein, putative, ty1-copia subclass [Tanacetum coccineum]